MVGVKFAIHRIKMNNINSIVTARFFCITKLAKVEIVIKRFWQWGTKVVEEEREMFMSVEESFMHLMTMLQNGEITQEEFDRKTSSGELVSKGKELKARHRLLSAAHCL